MLNVRCAFLSSFDFALTSVTLPTSFVPRGNSVPSGNFTVSVTRASTSSPCFAFFVSIRFVNSAETLAAATGYFTWGAPLPTPPVCACSASEKIATGTSAKYFIIMPSGPRTCSHANHDLPSNNGTASPQLPLPTIQPYALSLERKKTRRRPTKKRPSFLLKQIVRNQASLCFCGILEEDVCGTLTQIESRP